MKIVKKIGIVILIIIAIPLLMAIFIKKEYRVERSITVNKPSAEVFNYIKYLKNQDHYSKWVMTDPAMKKDFRGTDGTVGFVYAWDGNKDAGKGEQEIKSINEGKGMDVEVRFKRPIESVAEAPMTTEAISPAQTKLTWAIIGNNKYPLNFMNLFMDNMLGKDMEKSLGTLKGILEK